MLREITSSHQINQHKPKRHFRGSNMDLCIWFKNQIPVCFQLSYNKHQQEHAISWNIKTGFSHILVRVKHRPINYRINTNLGSNCSCEFNVTTTAREFLQASDQIETTLADFIFARLIEYPSQLETHSNPVLVAKNG